MNISKTLPDIGLTQDNSAIHKTGSIQLRNVAQSTKLPERIVAKCTLGKQLGPMKSEYKNT